jgi:hypothetical protein
MGVIQDFTGGVYTIETLDESSQSYSERYVPGRPGEFLSGA